MQKENKAALSKQERARRNKTFNRVLYAVSACLILFGVFIILRDRTGLFSRNSAAAPNVTFPPDAVIETYTPMPTAHVTQEIASVAPLPSQNPSVPSAPVSIYFEGHEVSVAVVPVGVNEKGEMDTVPRYDIAGWYEYGAAPNEKGNCIIAGHNRYGGQKGLFSLLHDGLAVGDRVCVTMENGESVFYTVVSIDNYRYDSVPASVMAESAEQKLTLITCLGDYDWDLQMSKTRVVAVCEPIN